MGNEPNQNVSTKSILKDVKQAPKNVAAQFFKKPQSLLLSAELSFIRKAIVSMKVHRDCKDIRSYLQSACDVVKVVIFYEALHSNSKNMECGMMFLFFTLLPHIYRCDVENMSMNIIFDKSKIANLLKANLLLPDTFKSIRLLIVNLLCMIWCGNFEVRDNSPICSKAKYLS